MTRTTLLACGAAIVILPVLVGWMAATISEEVRQGQHASWMQTCTMTAHARHGISLDQAFEHCKASKKWLDEKAASGWK